MAGTDSILNITNGDSAVNLLQKAGIPGDFLPWRDVLHDGPVPADLDLDELSQLRADFIISRNWGVPENIRDDFQQRDRQLKSSHQYELVRLWFEHDLYDQLQILQLLDWFADNPASPSRLSLICTEHYLGLAKVEDVPQLLMHEAAINQKQLQLARTAWHAFREPSPQAWHRLLQQDTSALPFLEGAVLRLLQELPSCINGLSQTANTALGIIAAGETRPWKIFEAYQQSEDRRFMGDSSFWYILNDMLQSQPAMLVSNKSGLLQTPLLKETELKITISGRKLQAGELNWLTIHQPDQWFGGTHLTPENTWCWDDTIHQLTHHG